MKFAALALVAGVAADSFPSFDSLHAHCAMEVTFSDSVTNTHAKFTNLLKNFDDPNSGIYEIHSDSGSMLWATRTAIVNDNVDDVEFTFTADGDKTKISAKSRSQSLSYYDYYTNYCNMYNVIRAAAGGYFTTTNITECKWVPDDDRDCHMY